MSPIAHAASASLIAITFAHVRPDETPYILAALISATVVDLDHVVYLLRDRARYRRLGYKGNLHHARSIFHELFGLLSAGMFSALLFLVDPKLAHVLFVAFAVHLVQDWMMGKSYPLAPIDKTEVQFFSPTFKQKVLVDITVVIAFGALWLLYLAGWL